MSESITKQERIIAEVQDLYQPFIQERGGSGGAREDALKSIASVSTLTIELIYITCIMHYIIQCSILGL